MVNTDLIRQIVKTYDLPPKLEDRVVSIANRRISELGITGEDRAYRYIDYLVERFQPTQQRGRVLELDSHPFSSDTTFHDLIGSLDPQLTSLLMGNTDYHARPTGTSVNETLNILKSQISELEWIFLTQLAGIGRISEFSSPEKILMTKEQLLTEIPRIKERLEALRMKYEIKGRLRIPQRPIIYVNFDLTPSIKFGRRKFNGDYLSYFSSHLDVYEGMSRIQLQKIDQSLYGLLLNANQIQWAIPEKYGMTSQKINEIVAAHPIYRGIPSKAAKALGYDTRTVEKY